MFSFLSVAILSYHLFFVNLLQQTPSKVYIFQTSDIHGHLKNKPTKHSNGWLKMGSIMRKEIQDVGGYDNCLLIDCGDTFQGTVEALESKGELAVLFMNSLKYDAFIPGNHDFDFGFNIFLDRISNLEADVIAANLIIEPTNSSKFYQKKPKVIAKNKTIGITPKNLRVLCGENKSSFTKEIFPWKLYLKNNIKIAVIGMTSPYLKYWLWGNGHENYDVTSISVALEKIMPDVLKAKPEIIILASHHGLYNSKRFPGKDNFLRSIIKKYPQIDIVFGGHTHQIYPGEGLYNNGLYVQPGAYAEYFSKLEVEVDKSGKNPPRIKIELIPVLSTDKSDRELAGIAAETVKKSNLKSRKIIGKTDRVINDKGIPGVDNRICELFASAILNKVRVDAAMCTVIKSRHGLSGNITYNDIFNICPYEDTIITLSLNYDELKKIIKEQDTYKDKYRKKLGLYGVDFNQKNLLSFFKSKNRIKVAFSSYDVAGAGNRYPALKRIAQKPDVRAFDTQIVLRDAVVKYIKDKFLKEN